MVLILANRVDTKTEMLYDQLDDGRFAMTDRIYRTFTESGKVMEYPVVPAFLENKPLDVVGIVYSCPVVGPPGNLSNFFLTTRRLLLLI